jgi:hypothetical protein
MKTLKITTLKHFLVKLLHNVVENIYSLCKACSINLFQGLENKSIQAKETYSIQHSPLSSYRRKLESQSGASSTRTASESNVKNW